MEKIVRDKSSPENRFFWKQLRRTAAEVATWPAWKTGGYKFTMYCSKCPETKMILKTTCCSERRSGYNKKWECPKCRAKILVEKRDLKN